NIWSGWTLRTQSAMHRETVSRLLLGVGSDVRPFVGRLADGSGVVLDSSDGSAFILYAMSSTCPACLSNEQHIAEFVGQIGTSVPIYFLRAEAGLEEDSPPLLNVPDNVTVVAFPDIDSLKHYKISATPQTVVVRGGRILSA